VLAWEMLLKRRGLRLLDLGSGTGHWIDFFREVLLVTEVVGVEITERMAEHLRTKYIGDANVKILETDIAAPELSLNAIGGPVDYISAIGIMFHIVDDARSMSSSGAWKVTCQWGSMKIALVSKPCPSSLTFCIGPSDSDDPGRWLDRDIDPRRDIVTHY